MADIDEYTEVKCPHCGTFISLGLVHSIRTHFRKIEVLACDQSGTDTPEKGAKGDRH